MHNQDDNWGFRDAPDALVIATAIVLGADRIITTDGGWPEVPVRVEVMGRAG